MLIFNWLILLICLAFNILVFYWNGNLRNGSRSGAPFYFIKHAGTYAFIDIILFFVLLLFSQISWYVIIILYLSSLILGVTLSEAKYKKFLNDIIDDEEREKGIKFTKHEREVRLEDFYKAQKIIEKNKK